MIMSTNDIFSISVSIILNGDGPTAVSSAQLVDLRPGLSLAHTHTYEHHDETNDCENYEYMSNHLLP